MRGSKALRANVIMRLVVSDSLVRRLLTHAAGMCGCHNTPHIRCPLTSRISNLPGHGTHTTLLRCVLAK